MNSTLETIMGLLGGLAIFIYGMNLMSECLQKAAGERMKQILGLLTKNRLMGVLAGALVTAVLQSSSATTVMAIGFVSAGLMTLPQAISIIFGANIGTTITAQIIAFKLSDYIYLIIFAGFIVSFIFKNERVRMIGRTIFAFGLLFLGIETMGDVMAPLASSSVFTDMIAKVADAPVLGVAVGTIMTLVVQSSSATIAILQNFASQAAADGVTSILGLTGAIPILLGDNIGTTITALLACVGQSKDAKRTAVAHTIFNVSGALLFIGLVNPFAALVEMVSPAGIEVQVISRQIANAHTLFNVAMTLIWVILLDVMVKIVQKIIPDGSDSNAELSAPRYLDRNVLTQPAAALQLVAKEVLHTGELVKDMLKDVRGMLAQDAVNLQDIQSRGEAVSSLRAGIDDYLSELYSAGVLTENQANHAARLMYVLSEVERMSGQTVELAQAIWDQTGKRHPYSADATAELEGILSYIESMYSDALAAIATGDRDIAETLLARKDRVIDLDIEMRRAHMQRVRDGLCARRHTAPFMQTLHCIDRMGNSCVNLAEVAANRVSIAYFTGEKAKAPASSPAPNFAVGMPKG